jgi:hypothetical protein
MTHGSTGCTVKMLVDLIGEAKTEEELKRYEKTALRLALTANERIRIIEAIFTRTEEIARSLRDYAASAEARLLVTPVT